jgi:hypothetical protein
MPTPDHWQRMDWEEAGLAIYRHTCKIVRFRCSGKCQCNRKVVKVFGKIVFAVRSSERVDLFFSTIYLIQRALSLVYIQLFPP